MKLKALVLAAVASVGFSASHASASCSDTYVADCGTFKVLSTVCPAYNGDGVVSGFEETYSAVTENPNAATELYTFAAAHMPPRRTGKAFRAKKDADTDIYLVVESGIFTTWNLAKAVVSLPVTCTTL